MLIGIENLLLNFDARLVEPVINREASNYIIEHYDELLTFIRKNSIKEEKANDLLHDVYISMVESEDNCEGYDMNFCDMSDKHKNDTVFIDVAQFVYGRIKGYIKNAKYRTDVVEVNTGNTYETHVYYLTEIDKNGNEVLDKNGVPKKVKKVERIKKATMITANAASFEAGADSEEKNDEFQKAFLSASVADSTDDVTELLSLREQIDFCIDLCSMHNVNIMNVFKNLDELTNLVSCRSKRKKNADGVFSKITELAELHSDFGESLMSIIKFYSLHAVEFKSIIATY